MPLTIVDSQVHIWAGNSPERPWNPQLAHRAQRPEPFTKDMLLGAMDKASVARAVLVPPTWQGGGNGLALEAAHAHPGRFAVVGRLAIAAGHEGMIREYERDAKLLGFRLTFPPEEQGALKSDALEWLWTTAEEARIPLMVYASGALPHIHKIAQRHPELKLAIDHAGLNIKIKEPEVFRDVPSVCALAALPNVSLKLSGMPALSSEKYPFRDLHPHIRRLYDAFGPARTFWGTDLTRMHCSYEECVRLFTEELSWLKGGELEWVMGHGICDWLGWPL